MLLQFVSVSAVNRSRLLNVLAEWGFTEDVVVARRGVGGRTVQVIKSKCQSQQTDLHLGERKHTALEVQKPRRKRKRDVLFSRAGADTLYHNT